MVAALALATVTTPAQGAATSAGPPGLIQIVQAVPQQTLDVAIDGKTVDTASRVGAVLGPFSVSPGSHRVEFTGRPGRSSSSRRSPSPPAPAATSSSTFRPHPGGAPVVNSYRTPRGADRPGQGRVLIAHTATVAPADVRVDGKVVFHDIANGEYATADLAAGSHTVALLPAGLTTHPILGPLHVDLVAGHGHDGVRRGEPAELLDERHRPQRHADLERRGGAVDHRHRSGGAGGRRARGPVPRAARPASLGATAPDRAGRPSALRCWPCSPR